MVNGEFYVGTAIDELIHTGARIGYVKISASEVDGVGTPADLLRYWEKWNRASKAHSERDGG